MNNTKSYRNWTLLVARLALATTILPHGAQKVLGWYGGYGFSGTMNMFTSKMHIPAPLALAAILAEFFGALGILTGAFTRLSAFGVGVTMLVAGYMNLGNGYFANWFGNQKGEGIEYFIPVIGLSIPLLLEGAGAFSLDALVKKVRKAPVLKTVPA